MPLEGGGGRDAAEGSEALAEKVEGRLLLLQLPIWFGQMKSDERERWIEEGTAGSA